MFFEKFKIVPSVAGFSDLKKKIFVFRPDVVGVSCIVTCVVWNCLHILDIVFQIGKIGLGSATPKEKKKLKLKEIVFCLELILSFLGIQRKFLWKKFFVNRK